MLLVPPSLDPVNCLCTPCDVLHLFFQPFWMGNVPFTSIFLQIVNSLLLATNEDFVHGEVHGVLGRRDDICAAVVNWIFYGKQAFCTDDVLEKICQSVDKLYLCELTVY